MAFERTSIHDFEIAARIYALSTVTVYVANPDGSKGALATLYTSLSGLSTLPNPQTLDADGRFQQPVYIEDDYILEINSPTSSLDGDTGVASFGGRWRSYWTGPGTRYNRGDRLLGPIGTAQENNVYRSLSVWSSSGAWATDLADVTLMALELDYQALSTLALAAVPDASETVKGIAEIATQAETNTGTDDTRIVTPLKLASRTATEARAGIAEIATQTEVNTSANDTMIVSPAKLGARVSSETLQGIIAIATQTEVNQGTNDTEAVTPLKLAAFPNVGRRNIVRNGDFSVWQRNTTFSPSTGVLTNLADGWQALINGTVGTVAIDRTLVPQIERTAIAALTGSAPNYYLLWNHSVAGSAQTAKFLQNRVENLQIFQGRTVRLSFVTYSTSGTHGCSAVFLFNYGTGGAPSATDASAPQAFNITTTPTRHQFTFVFGDFSTKTFGTDGPHTSDLGVRFNLPLNATGILRFCDVQLEFGEVATAFERRQFHDHLSEAQRYFWKSFPYATVPATNSGVQTGAIAYRASNAGATARGERVDFPKRMRIAPTVAFFNPNAANTNWRNFTGAADSGASSVAVTASDRAALLSNAQAAGDAVGNIIGVHATADAEFA